jgi:hypothetical protein
VRVQGEKIDIGTLDLEKSRQRITAIRAARHDIRQLRRRSDWSDALWQSFLKGYEETFGADFKKI